MSISKQKEEEIKKAIEENPKSVAVKIAKELDISEEDVVKCYPKGIAIFTPIGHFEVIWDKMTEWEKVTFITANGGIIAEIGGKLSKGSVGHGYFNLFDKDAPLNGHIVLDNLGAIYFISKPFMGKESHSIQFFDKAGNQAFAVYVGRDENRELLPKVLTGFLEMKDLFSNSNPHGNCSSDKK